MHSEIFGSLIFSEYGSDQEDRIRLIGARLKDLIVVNEKVLPQKRP